MHKNIVIKTYLKFLDLFYIETTNNVSDLQILDFSMLVNNTRQKHK